MPDDMDAAVINVFCSRVYMGLPISFAIPYVNHKQPGLLTWGALEKYTPWEFCKQVSRLRCER